MSAVRAERAGIIASPLLRVRPEVFLVDHAPLGMKGELGLALKMAREELPDTRVVLGLRDVLDEPDVVRATWSAQGVYQILETAYDQIIVYGSRELFDAASEYGIPDSVARRVQFSGYLAKDRGLEQSIDGRETWAQARRAGDRRVVVMGGGVMARLGLAQVARLDGDGDVAARVADAMVAALKAGPPPAHAWRSIDLRGTERVADLLLEMTAPVSVQVAA